MSRKWTKGDLSGEKGYRVCYYAPGREFKVMPPVGKPPLKSMSLANLQRQELVVDMANSDLCILDESLHVRSPRVALPKYLRN